MRIRIAGRRFREEGGGDGGDGGGGGNPDATWRDSLPEEMRGNTSLQEIGSVEALTKRFLDGQSMISQSIRMPGPDASADDMSKFRERLLEKKVGLMAVPDFDDADAMQNAYKALGLPEDSKGYDRPEKWPGMTDDRYNTLASQAHELGISKKQFDKMALKMAEADSSMTDHYAQEHNTAITDLKTEWGNAYTQKVARATDIAKQLEAPAGLQAALADGNADAGTLKWLDQIAERFGKEGNSLVADPAHQVSEHTPAEVQERITEITKKMLDMDASDPAYQGLLQKRLKYFEIAKAS